MTGLIGVKGMVGVSFIRPDKVIAVHASPTGGTAILMEGKQTIVTSEAATAVAGRIKHAESDRRLRKRTW